MKRVLWAVLCAGLVSGCYTMIRHPPIQQTEAPAGAAETDRCIACHEESELDAMAWWLHDPSAVAALTPLWGTAEVVYQPWWWRHPASSTKASRHLQGGALANDRPPLAPLPPPAAPPLLVQPPIQSVPPVDRSAGADPSSRQGEPAAGPHSPPPGEVQPPGPDMRQGNPATSPRAPVPRQPPAAAAAGTAFAAPGTQTPAPAGADSSATSDSTASPSSPASPPTVPQQGHGMKNDRPGRPQR